MKWTLIISFLVAVSAYVIVECFKDGYKEGSATKAKMDSTSTSTK
ncbi:MAG: hypothetical protein ABI415_07630 [Flavitalea sp.]